MISLHVNGKNHIISAEEDELLVWVIREKIGLTRTKFGCGIKTCGACSVLVDGVATHSCTTHIADVVGKKILTREALPEDHTFNFST